MTMTLKLISYWSALLAILLALNALRVWLDRRQRRAELAQLAREWDEFTEAWYREHKGNPHD
jgi:hypothetical protein